MKKLFLQIMFIFSTFMCLCACRPSVQSPPPPNTPIFSTNSTPEPSRTIQKPTPSNTAVIMPLSTVTIQSTETPIRVQLAVDPFAPPFSDIDPGTGEFIGYDLDLMYAVAQFANLEVDIQPIPSSMQLSEVAECNVDLAATHPQQEINLHGFSSDPYLQTHYALISRNDGLAILTIEDLTDLHVGVSPRISTGVLSDIPSYTFRNHDNAILDLRNGELDAILTSLPEAEYFTNEFVEELHFAEIPSSIQAYSIAICPQRPELKALVDDAIVTITFQGLLPILEQKWLSRTPGHVPIEN